jgi:branched-chain amino acid transport system permease protein
VVLLPSKHLILTEIAILALFALSLDLILGYAGIISLGHAAFFGFGAYVAGLLAKHGIINEPLLALLASGVAAMLLGFVTSFLVLRGSDLHAHHGDARRGAGAARDRQPLCRADGRRRRAAGR